MRRSLLIGFPLLLVLVLGGILLTTRASQSSGLPAKLAGTDVWPPGTRPAPNFALRDQAGRTITRASLRHHVSVITFFDSRCTKACPVGGRDLGTALRDLGPHPAVSILVISVAPQHDSPASERHFMKTARIHSQWHWLSGTTSQLRPVWNRYGIWVQNTPADILHTAVAYLVDQTGDVRVADAMPFIPLQLAESIRFLLLHPSK